MEKLVDIVKKAGFTVMDVYGDGSAITAFNDVMELYDDVLLLQNNGNELLFCTKTFPVRNLFAALLLVNELNGLTDLGMWRLEKKEKEAYISFFCRFVYLERSLSEFAQNYLKVLRALRLFHEQSMSGKTLDYCATLRAEEDDIPEEELVRVKHIQILYEEGRLKEAELSPQDARCLEKLLERGCMEIRHEGSKLKYCIFHSLRDITNNRRKLERL